VGQLRKNWKAIANLRNVSPAGREVRMTPKLVFHAPARKKARGSPKMIAATPQEKQGRLKTALEHASGDKRFKILEAHMKKHQFRQDALIEVLHKAQELFGYLEDDLLLFVSYKLKLPPSRVYGVATFYHFFTLKPQGKHTCVICMGTACYVKGAEKILAAVEEHIKVKPGETTPDNQVSLLTARCIGACGIAPAVVYDGTVTPRQTAAAALEQIGKWEAK
jgi:bidirectional [NiFe] hydrogenase diaphorase subunit